MINNMVKSNRYSNDRDSSKCPGCAIYNPSIYDCNKCVHKEYSHNNSWKINVFSDSNK